MIWIIGGTSEAGQLLERIHNRVDYIATVATYVGSEMLKGKNTVVKRLSYEDMLVFIDSNNIKTVIDLSHPYAVEVSENAKKASKHFKVEYIRFVREKTILDDESFIRVNNIKECLEYLKLSKGTVFFTTGSKNIVDFEKIRKDNRFIYRVLPSKFSIEECIKNNIELKDIIAILGPFSESLNISLFKEYDVKYVVMKDSGDKGGTKEKLTACQKLGIKAIMIGREDEIGVSEIEKLVEMIL